jgi:hypothetical protein
VEQAEKAEKAEKVGVWSARGDSFPATAGAVDGPLVITTDLAVLLPRGKREVPLYREAEKMERHETQYFPAVRVGFWVAFHEQPLN